MTAKHHPSRRGTDVAMAESRERGQRLGSRRIRGTIAASWASRADRRVSLPSDGTDDRGRSPSHSPRPDPVNNNITAILRRMQPRCQRMGVANDIADILRRMQPRCQRGIGVAAWGVPGRWVGACLSSGSHAASPRPEPSRRCTCRHDA